MKFAFLIHPISTEVSDLTRLDAETGVLKTWGTDPLGLLARIHGPEAAKRYGSTDRETSPVVIDEIYGPPSRNGKEVVGRLIEIPMKAAEILEYPDAALEHIERAVKMAADWGAGVVGLGAMTAVVGGRGTWVAERSPIAITTGNSLTVYAAIQGLFHAAEELNFDLRQETIAVVGVPGSIASAAAILLAPHCGQLLIVGRNASAPSQKLADKLGVELLMDIPEACRRARIILSATSSGNCIDQSFLQPGTIVVDVGVPADVIGDSAERPDILVLTGGLAAVPEDGRWHSPRVIRFQRGMIPSCMGETMMLALEDRPECLSLGRVLDVEKIAEIGAIATANGFRFSRLCSFGQVLDESVLTGFRKYIRRDPRRPAVRTNDKIGAAELAKRAPACYRRHLNPPLAAFTQQAGIARTFVRGEGAFLYDADGKRYLDLVAGYGAVNLGHNHPAVVDAVKSALSAYPPGFTPSAINPYAAALAEELVSLAPAGLEIVFFTNSGTESTEAALKLARASTGRFGMLHCLGSFHGKTLGSLSVTGKNELQQLFQPLIPGGTAIPFGDLEALERELVKRTYAAFIVEPVQGEAGIYIPPPGYLKRAEHLCRETGTLLIVDEVQTGFGRTGALFACEHEGVEPDVLTLAKSLGGGLAPIGAMIARRDAWDRAYGTVQTCLLHTSTFGGGSLACAAALATVRAIVKEDLASRARDIGERLRAGLHELCSRYKCLKEVRGKGLMIGIEFQRWPQTAVNHWKSLDETGLSQYMIRGYDGMVSTLHTLQAMYILLNRFGMYVQSTRSNPAVIRIQPPLMIAEAEIDRFLDVFAQTCREVDHICGALTGGVSKSSLGKHDARGEEVAPAEVEANGRTVTAVPQRGG
jgi:acetylornithine/succinyldiaminopimelate/putrescine aminotransferase/predicted amino acid dehydrogenase